MNTVRPHAANRNKSRPGFEVLACTFWHVMAVHQYTLILSPGLVGRLVGQRENVRLARVQLAFHALDDPVPVLGAVRTLEREYD